MSVRTIVRAVVPLVVVVTTAAATSAAVPDTWTPVKDNPKVDELFPSPHGGFFGWAQSTPGNPEHFNFLVERKDGTRVKVNAAGTQGLAGDIVGHSVFYLQQLSDRPPRIQRYDLKTGKRSPLPAKVNKSRTTIRAVVEYPPPPAGGYLTASGPWLLYGGQRIFDPDSYPLHTVMLYNRVTHELRDVRQVNYEEADLFPGQVNGRYAVWVVADSIDDSDAIERYDIKTEKIESLVTQEKDGHLVRSGASVSADGTVYYFEVQYYFEGTICDPSDCTYKLMRLAPDGTKTVLATVLQTDARPGPTYVKDRPDGSHVVYIALDPTHRSGPGHDIYKFVDEPLG